MITFVDTSGWVASVLPEDPGHTAMVGYVSTYTGVLLTTDYVIDEALTLLRARGLNHRALQFGRVLYDLRPHRIYYLERSDIQAAWSTFRDQPERGWSFTDCTSKVVIERFHIKRVLTLDRHFAEFGALAILP